MFNPLQHTTPLRDREYLAHLIREHDVRQVVEVGCYVGMTTRSMVRASADVVVHAIDHFQGTASDDNGELTRVHGSEAIHRTFCTNLREYLFRRVFLHVGTSEQYAAVWPFRVDMVFLDADHTYEGLRRDIELWLPHVRNGGVLCGHDYGAFEGVDRAADELGLDEVENFVWMKRLSRDSRNGVRRTG